MYRPLRYNDYYHYFFNQPVKIRCFSCKKKYESSHANCPSCGAKNSGHLRYNK